MNTSVVSSQGQTTIPVEIRSQLGITTGSAINWTVDLHKMHGVPTATITTSSVTSIKSLRGVAKNTYKKYGGAEKYLQAERASWDK